MLWNNDVQIKDTVIKKVQCIILKIHTYVEKNIKVIKNVIIIDTITTMIFLTLI